MKKSKVEYDHDAESLSESLGLTNKEGAELREQAKLLIVNEQSPSEAFRTAEEMADGRAELMYLMFKMGSVSGMLHAHAHPHCAAKMAHELYGDEIDRMKDMDGLFDMIRDLKQEAQSKRDKIKGITPLATLFNSLSELKAKVREGGLSEEEMDKEMKDIFDTLKKSGQQSGIQVEIVDLSGMLKQMKKQTPTPRNEEVNKEKVEETADNHVEHNN